MEEMNNPSGTSLLVPSVQELVKENSSTVPQRYIRTQHDDHLVNSEAGSTLEVPVIDMHKLLSEEYGGFESAKLHLACKDWGFFQLINHGVMSSIFLEKVKLEIQDFFNLPMSEKKIFWESEHHMEGFGQAFVVSEEQKLDWGDMFYMTTLPKHLRMPHLFPKLPLPFRDTRAILARKKNLAKVIIAHLEKALELKEKEMVELFEDGIQMMRMNYYPPCPQPEKVIGLVNHSDPEAITILLQLNEVEGLQIRKNGIWVPIKPIPNAFIVNIGDILEIMTNGIYRSIEHRAVVNSEKERLSIATFYSPRQDSVIGPAASLVTEETPARFSKIGVKEFFTRLFSQEFYGKSYIDSMRKIMGKVFAQVISAIGTIEMIEIIECYPRL